MVDDFVVTSELLDLLQFIGIQWHCFDCKYVKRYSHSQECIENHENIRGAVKYYCTYIKFIDYKISKIKAKLGKLNRLIKNAEESDTRYRNIIVIFDPYMEQCLKIKRTSYDVLVELKAKNKLSLGTIRVTQKDWNKELRVI
ncbi:hypothetical protein LCGC14_0900460 [marine sediment metagenome]|uniref:Uncharacterized protein n=1 Tax=marine sediment metagenome TaxID=412755 RepID=A0A0F9P1I0_9ZZZZ